MSNKNNDIVLSCGWCLILKVSNGSALKVFVFRKKKLSTILKEIKGSYCSLVISLPYNARVPAPYFFFVFSGCEQCNDENAPRKRQKTPPEPGASSSLTRSDRTEPARPADFLFI